MVIGVHKYLLTACAVAATLAMSSHIRAEEASEEASVASEKTDLQEIAKRPEVQEELEEPDGVSVEDLDTDNWKIMAMGTGTYEFNDAEERKDATEEAILEAKAAMAKFAKERLAAESQLDILAERESKKSKSNGATDKSASTKRMKTTLTRIHNSADEILSGVLTLETTSKWDGDSGEVRVKIGQSEKSLAAAKKFKSRTGQAINEADRDSAATASGSKPAAGSGPSTTKRKSKTAF